MSFPYPLVSTDWLADNLENVRVIDASWRMPGAQHPAYEDYLQRHIPRAVFFDIDVIADNSTDLPHMAPSPQEFAKSVGAMGVSESDLVIVYDDQGIFSAARVWWTFRLMGHENVAVLDGGLKKWLADNREVEGGETILPATTYRPSAPRAAIADADTVLKAIETADARILDARPRERFAGLAPEPRTGLRSGAMPRAYSLPASDLVTATGEMIAPEAIRDLLSALGFTDDDRSFITTCGSGVTAAIIALALERVGVSGVRLYDGSWAEWAREENADRYPVVNG